MNRSGEFRVTQAEKGKRLDVVVAQKAGISRNAAQTLISQKLITVDGAPSKKNHILLPGELITWEIPEKAVEALQPEELPLDVVYFDEYLIVVDKPAGMVMYPAPGHESGTLINALLRRYPEIAEVGSHGRPGVFHRLDKDTSGLVAVARTQEAYLAMVEMMRRREVSRTYLALARGEIPVVRGLIEAPIGRSLSDRKKMSVRLVGGREAITKFEVIRKYCGEYTLAKVFLETGRTHQIRVHFSFIGHPIAGDRKYSRDPKRKSENLRRQFLHAAEIRFRHPFTRKNVILESPLADDLCIFLKELESRHK